MTHEPSPQDTGVPGDGLVPSAGRTGASSEPFVRLVYHECDPLPSGRGRCIEIRRADSILYIARFRERSVLNGVSDDQRAYGRLFVASPDLFNACAPFADAPDYGTLPDDAVVLRGNSEGLFLTAGQVRAIKAAMARAKGISE